MAPGTYYVKEMETDAVKQAGYAVWSQPVAVAVEAGRLVKPVVAGTEDLIYEAEITNQADQGRLLIQKTDQNGQLLDGAVFAVYAKDSEGNWKAEPEQTQMVTAEMCIRDRGKEIHGLMVIFQRGGWRVQP